MKQKKALVVFSFAGLGAMLLAGCGNTKAHEHSFSNLHAKVDATCLSSGMEAYYTCTGCDKYFNANKEEVSKDSLVITKKDHSLEKTIAKDPQCEQNGNIEYYTCSTCSRLFSDSQGANQITAAQTIVPMTGHSIVKVDGKAPTATEDGWKDYYTCSHTGCGKCFEDLAGEHPIADLEEWKLNEGYLPATGVEVTLTVVGGTGGGTFNKGTEVTVKAEVPENKEFVCWKDGETSVSTDAEYTFKILKDMTLTAEFKYTEAYIERDDLLYDKLCLDPNKAYSEVRDAELLQEGSAVAYKLSATEGWPNVSFDVPSVQDFTTKRIEVDAKCLKGKAWFSMKFMWIDSDNQWNDVMNPDNPSKILEMGQDITSDWATYSIYLPENTEHLNSIICFKLVVEGEGQAEGTEVLFDNMHFVDYKEEEWYKERNDLSYSLTVAEEKAGNHFEKVTEGLQEGSVAAWEYYNDGEGVDWPSILLQLKDSVDLTKNKLVLDAKLLQGHTFFSLKFYDSKWNQYTGIGEKGTDLVLDTWKSVEFGRFTEGNDVKFIRINLDNYDKGMAKVIIDNMRLDNSNYGTFTSTDYVESTGLNFKPATSEEMFGKMLSFNYKLEGGSEENEYFRVVLMGENWKNVSGDLRLNANYTAGKNGVVTDLGNGWHKVVFDTAYFDGDSVKNGGTGKFDALRIEGLVGGVKKLTIDYDTFGFIDAQREHKDGVIAKFQNPLANWKTSGKSIQIDFEPGSWDKQGQKFVIGLRNSDNKSVAMFTIRLTDKIVQKGNAKGSDPKLSDCTQVEGTVYRAVVALADLDAEGTFTGAESVSTLNCEEVWMSMNIHAMKLI